jgi:hypothetical protein
MLLEQVIKRSGTTSETCCMRHPLSRNPHQVALTVIITKNPAHGQAPWSALEPGCRRKPANRERGVATVLLEAETARVFARGRLCGCYRGQECRVPKKGIRGRAWRKAPPTLRFLSPISRGCSRPPSSRDRSWRWTTSPLTRNVRPAALLEERGCEPPYLLPYSPDLSFIEQAFSKIKGILGTSRRPGGAGRFCSGSDGQGARRDHALVRKGFSTTVVPATGSTIVNSTEARFSETRPLARPQPPCTLPSSIRAKRYSRGVTLPRRAAGFLL